MTPPTDPTTGRAIVSRGIQLAGAMTGGPRLLVLAHRDIATGRIAVELETSPRRSLTAYVSPAHARALAATLAGLADLAEQYSGTEV